MKLIVTAFAGLSLVSMTTAQLELYTTLFNACETGSPHTYVGVQYAGATGIQTFEYGECYPYEINGNLAEMAVWCRSVTCYDNPNIDCAGGAVPPIGIPIPGGFTLENVADFVQLLGQGATCEPNGLP